MFPKENLCGDGQELPLSDLPNYRHVVQLAKLKAQRKDNFNPAHPVYGNDIVQEVTNEVIAKWTQATFPPDKMLAHKSVWNKVKKLLKEFPDIENGKGSAAVRNIFMTKLDQLFPVLICSCLIKVCCITSPGTAAIPRTRSFLPPFSPSYMPSRIKGTVVEQ